MSLPRMLALALVVLTGGAFRAGALDRPDVTFQVFQFPTDKIPRVDGNTDDWTMVADDVEGPDGKSQRSKVWDVQVKWTGPSITGRGTIFPPHSRGSVHKFHLSGPAARPRHRPGVWGRRAHERGAGRGSALAAPERCHNRGGRHPVRDASAPSP